jgi:hypothetical protein
MLCIKNIESLLYLYYPKRDIYSEFQVLCISIKNSNDRNVKVKFKIKNK